MFRQGLSLQRLAKEPSIVLAAMLSIVLFNMASLHLAIDAQSSSSEHHHQQHPPHWFATMNATIFSAFVPSFRSSTRIVSKIPNNYDWSRSTEDNHRAKDDSIEAFLPSKFRSLRQRLDRSYHSVYSLERQAVQDTILESLLYDTKIIDAESGQECSIPQTPWIVFTAGVYGAGKTHTIKKIQERGQFPLESFVAVDPDEIRRRLPEFPVYVERTPDKAGEMTRKEAGMMAEILTNFALEKGMNVLVDGSLKDAEWYENYFQKLRSNYPRLQIGIIHVTAPVEAVIERVKQRGKETGRVVPMDALKRSMMEVPKAVMQLRNSVDYFLEIHNPQEPHHSSTSEKALSLEAANEISQSEIANSFQQRCAAG